MSTEEPGTEEEAQDDDSGESDYNNDAPGKLRFRFGSEPDNSCYGVGPDGIKRKWNDPEHLTPKETTIQAVSLEDAREHFCSTVEDPELHVGRVLRENPEPATVPRGVNLAGKPYDPKPTMPDTKDIPDHKIIQIWQYDRKEPDWFYGKWEDAHQRTGYPYRLVAELPLADLYKYDVWGQQEHPALPAPETSTLEPGATALAKLDDQFKAKPIRQFSRAQIAIARSQMKAKQLELEGMLQVMKEAQRKLSAEMEFRSEQLRYLTLYLGRNVPIDLIQKGQKADDNEMVHIRQRVLYMAEEVGVIAWNAEVGFDFRNIRDFDKWVTEPENLYIIAPEPKCIVFMKPRRSPADYGNPLVSFLMNRENTKVYVLFRNGMTVYRAQLDLDIPDRLFPEEEKFEQQLEEERESKIPHFWGWGSEWEWKTYQKKWDERKKWYAKGFTDADFQKAIKYKTKEEMLAALAKEKAEHDALEANPKETIPLQKRDLERVYARYQEELKEFYFGLAYLQGVFDRTDIFGNLQGKVNLFTGLGLGVVPGTVQYAKLVYDLSESRMLEDKATMTLPAWLKSEAKKVKVGDYVIVKATISHEKGDRLVSGIAQVVKMKAPGVVKARMNGNPSVWSYWYRDAPKKSNGIIHKLQNDERNDEANSVVFYPYKLPMDNLKFYLDRRADRDKYWDNLLVDLLRLKRATDKKEVPKISTVTTKERIDTWRHETKVAGSEDDE